MKALPGFGMTGRCVIAACVCIAGACAPPKNQQDQKPADGSSPAEGTITVDGQTWDLVRLAASTDASADEYVPGKKLVMSAYVDDPDIAVFIDFDDLVKGSAPAVPYGTPDVTVLFDKEDYRALAATVEVVEGSLDEGATVHVRVPEATYTSDCDEDDKVVSIDMTATVDRQLPQSNIDDGDPAAGSVIGTFTVAGEQPVRYIGLVDGEIRPLSDGPTWFMGSSDRCASGALAWQFLFAVPESVAVGTDVPLAGGPVDVYLDEVDTAARVNTRSFVAVAGAVRTDNPVTDDPHGRARMELTGVRMSEIDTDGNIIDGGQTVTLDQATLNASVGAGLIVP